MSNVIQDLRDLLDDRDLSGFLSYYEANRLQLLGQPGLGQCTQRLLPPLLRELFKANRVEPECVVRLWRLVRSGHLLVVENDLLEAINARIDAAVAERDNERRAPTPKLSLYAEGGGQLVSARVTPSTPQCAEPAIPMKRIVVSSTYTFGVMAVSDALSCKKNLCASSQELEFLKAVRQFFPGLRAYPNLPLRNFIDLGLLGHVADEQLRKFCWSSQVDVLLCSEDEDPVGGIELDSLHHDEAAAQERDLLKNRLFGLAGLPLVRIRADDTSNIRAEDFYDLLTAEQEALEVIRPRRLRPRRNHDVLVPAEMSLRRHVGARA